MLPGYEVKFRDGGLPRGVVGSTDQGFGVAEAERGPTEATLITSWTQLLAVFGGRLSTSFLYDAAETAFAIGLRRLWVARVTGPAAARAGLNLSDVVPATTLRIDAKWVGAYGNNFTVQILTSVDDASIAVGSFRIRVRESGTIVEDSPIFASKAEALTWSGTGTSLADPAQTVRLTDQAGTGVPARLAATALTGGADDRASIVEAQWTAALDRFSADLGPGQVAGFGRTTTAWRAAVIDHARTRGRHAVLDCTDTSSDTTVRAEAVAANAAATSSGGRTASAYWPWVKVTGVGRIGTRTVPPSAAMFGLFAAVEAQAGPGQGAAGEEFGGHDFMVGLSQDTKQLTDSQREALNDAGVNLFREFYGLGHPINYGNRTLVSASVDPVWKDVSGSRVMMLIAARGTQIIRTRVHKRIDGRGIELGKLKAELGAILFDLWQADALFGATFADAGAVVTDDSLNSPASLASGFVRAVVEARTSPNPERAVLEIVRVPITEGV
jgi:phage tail sheath protein FI